VGRTEINAQGQNDLCYVSESLLGKLTGGTENLPIYRGSVNVQQTNLVTTKENYTLRGLHYQQNDFAEAKFFRVISGSIQLAFARVNRIPLLSDSVILSEPDVGVLVPRGFATGYLTLAENTSVLYLSDNVYRADHEAGIRWNDPSLSINWQSQSPILSEKDQKWPNF